MAMMTEINEPSEVKDFQGDAQIPYFHACVGEVDAKVKIVATGQPSEAVSVFCTRVGGSRKIWDERVEDQAYRLLNMLRDMFPQETFKVIPLSAHNSVGIKVHPVYKVYPTHRQKKAIEAPKEPTPASMAIFTAICEALEHISYQPENRPVEHRYSNHHYDLHMSAEEESELRSELARILVSAQQIDSKIECIFRALGRHGMH